MDNILGQTITVIRPMTKAELKKEGWEDTSGHSSTVMVLGNGTKLYASRDEEGNGPGAIFGVDKRTSFMVFAKEEVKLGGRGSNGHKPPVKKAYSKSIKIKVWHWGNVVEAVIEREYSAKGAVYRILEDGKVSMGLVSVAWKLSYLRVAIENFLKKVDFLEVCNMVGMPRGYDWSFIRDAEDSVKEELLRFCHGKVGDKLTKLGLECAIHVDRALKKK